MTLQHSAPNCNPSHSNSFWHYLAVNRLRAASDGNLGAGPADNAEPPENEEPDMSNPTELIDRYVAMWNETDASSRRNLLSRTWSEQP
ncbi:MAG: hypothetical protein ABSG76_21075, partial [Xanthobacteraceae bacterium]